MAKALEIDEPPELYYIMRSIADYEKKWSDQTPLAELAGKCRQVFFYDSYPLNSNVIKEQFEIDILNHFLHRRINFDTVAAFKVALITKLREIMPGYNLMFELINSDIFTDVATEQFDSRKDNEGGYTTDKTGGYTTDKVGGYNTDINSTTLSEENTNKNASKAGGFNEQVSNNSTEDLRNSDTPQNRLGDIRDGEYVSEYNYNQRNFAETKQNTHSDTENETGRNTGNVTENEILRNTHSDKDTNLHQDTDMNEHNDTDIFTHTKTNTNKSNLLEKLQSLQEYKNIMTLIYSDLDCLFLGVFDY